MQKLIAAAGAISLIAATAAFAGDTAPLPAGKPAGVARAQDILDNTPLLLGLGIAGIVAAVIVASDNNSTISSTATTTST